MVKEIALVPGNGSAPEMMEQGARIAVKAARLDGVEIKFTETPMGWCTYEQYGDTTPPEHMAKALEIGTIFFGGVGDPSLDATIGKQFKEMKPEARALLQIRKGLGLLLNFRPMQLMPELIHLSPLRPELIPNGINVHFIRELLEDSYFGTQDLRSHVPDELCKKLGIKLLSEVTGDEEMVTELAYYRRETLERYMRAAFSYAQKLNLPVISLDKSNVMARYMLWRKVLQGIAAEFPDVPYRSEFVDAGNALLFKPRLLEGVVICGNEHGDLVSDGGAEMVGGLGMMHSSAINPVTGQAMFESGAGTAPTLAGKDLANPIGRILTAAMMLRHIGADSGAVAIEGAVEEVLEEGYRTADIAEPGCTKALKCSEMGETILMRIA